MELLECVELLAGAGECDRPTDDLFHRQRGTASRVAVELGEDHAVDAERGMERLGHTDGVLSGHGVDDEEGVVRLDGVADLADLLHELGVDGQTAGGVDDEHVLAETPGLIETALGGVHRVGGIAEHRDVDLTTECAQLLDGGGTLQVGPDQKRMAALRCEPLGELGRVGRLARTLQTSHEHHSGRAAGIGDLERLATQDRGELLVDELDDLLAGVECLGRLDADGTLADARHHGAHHRHVDVGLEKSGADLAQHLVDIGLGEAALALDALEDSVETVGEIVEHDDAETTGVT